MKFLSFLSILIIVINFIHINAFFDQFSKGFKKGQQVFTNSSAQGIASFNAMAKQFYDVMEFDLNKLNLKNLTQLLPFFDSFINQFKKTYANDNDREIHMGFFRSTLERVKQHNKEENIKFSMGVNELSDLNYTEIQKQKTGFKEMPDKDADGDVMVMASVPVPNVDNMPEEWDWRKYGILTTPRNQGKCGSCWSFAAATVLESHNMKRLIAEGKFDKTKPITVSEQNLIDCSGEKFGSIGCDGGIKLNSIHKCVGFEGFPDPRFHKRGKS